MQPKDSYLATPSLHPRPTGLMINTWGAHYLTLPQEREDWPVERQKGEDQPTMQGFIGLDHLRHEHGPLASDIGKGAQRSGQVDGGDGGVHHELEQLLQSCLALFP